MEAQFKGLFFLILVVCLGVGESFANRGINLHQKYEKYSKSHLATPIQSPHNNLPDLDQRIPKEYLQNIQRSRSSSPYVTTQKQAAHLNEVIRQSAKHTKKSHDIEKERSYKLQKFLYHQFRHSPSPNYDPNFRQR